MTAYINSISYYLPPNKLDNKTLSDEFKTWTADQIFLKTGIKNRFVVTNETASDLAFLAFKELTFDPNFDSNKIDYLIYVNQTQEYLIPSGSFIFLSKLNLSIPSIDLNTGCSGYVNALFLAKSLIISKSASCVLIVTTETYSSIINKKDKSVRTLFGDGASCTIVSNENFGFEIGSFDQGTSPKDYEKLIVPGIGIKHRNDLDLETQFADANGYIRTKKNLYMDGPAIMSFTLDKIPISIKKTLLNNNLSNISQVNHFILHQASLFVLNSLKKILKLSTTQNFIINLEDKGNTVSSSIPIALKENFSSFKPIDSILLSGFGVGLSWSTCIIYKV
jgi:3-oxoacyl-[acyl-carrier-protein] synthase-3